MRKTILLSALGLACGLLSTAAVAQSGYGYGQSGGIVRCESPNDRWNQCPVDTRSGVELVRQLSRAACVRGRTWGEDARGIWVDGGCRGEFRVGYGGGHAGGRPGGSGQLFRCESDNRRSRQCAIDAPGRVRLIRQLSATACIEGRTWGQDGRGIWVNNGCRGEFQVVPGRGGDWSRWRNRDDRYSGDYDIGYGSGYRQAVRCESDDGRGRRCAANIQRGVQLQRQMSSSACIEGRSWGWDRSGIWVDQGCRADFVVW